MKNKSCPLAILLSLICILNLSCTANSHPQAVVRQPDDIARQAAASPTLKGSLDMVCAEDIAVNFIGDRDDPNRPFDFVLLLLPTAAGQARYARPEELDAVTNTP